MPRSARSCRNAMATSVGTRSAIGRSYVPPVYVGRTVRVVTSEHEGSPERPASVLWSAGMVLANLVVAFAALFLIVARDEGDLLPQDVWMTFPFVLWGQAALSGMLMLGFTRTRRIGLGVLLGTVVTVVLFFSWLWFVVLPNFY